MANLLPESETTEVEGRLYINPQTGVDESNTFIENLRNIQQTNTQQIATDTHNLGTDVPSNLGGLGGATSYWTSRYQTPQTASAIADLRTAAQAQALNEALANEQAVWKQRYQNAYRNYQKRQYAKANTPATTGPTTGGGGLDVDTNSGGGGSTEVSQYTGGEYQKGKLYPVTNSLSDYQDSSGQWWQVSNPNFRDISFGPTTNPIKYKQTNENVVTVNGKSYIYLNNVPNRDAAWYPVTRSAGPGTYSY